MQSPNAHRAFGWFQVNRDDTTQTLFMKKLLPTSLAMLLAPSMHGIIIVNDSFADGDRAQTGALDTNWWTSSSSAGDEIAVGSLGLVTGTSGRGLHTTFPTQTLANDGDSLVLSYTFTTPATIGSGSSSFRVGVYDTLGRALGADISASSGSPNALYGWSVGNGGPGDPGLPGYMLDHDVNTGAAADLNFRDHNTGSATGRLMSTTGGGSFSSFTSGPDEGYTFDPDTSYTGSITLTRTGAGIDLTGTLGGASYTVNDAAPDSFEFGMLAFHVNSNQFGSSNSAGDPDNGIDFTNVTIEFNSIPEPSSMGLLLFGGMLALRRRRA